MRIVLPLLALLAVLSGCGAGSIPNVNDSFDELECVSRDFREEGDPC